MWSGCPDLNRGPLRPERSALTKLRHSPSPVPQRRRSVEPSRASGAGSSSGGCGRPVGRTAAAPAVGVRSAPARRAAGAATTLATRRLSISATRSSQPSTVRLLALLGDVAEAVEEEAAERHVLALGHVDAQPLADVVDAGPAVDQPAGAVDPDDVGLVVRRSNSSWRSPTRARGGPSR